MGPVWPCGADGLAGRPAAGRDTRTHVGTVSAAGRTQPRTSAAYEAPPSRSSEPPPGRMRSTCVGPARALASAPARPAPPCRPGRGGLCRPPARRRGLPLLLATAAPWEDPERATHLSDPGRVVVCPEPQITPLRKRARFTSPCERRDRFVSTAAYPRSSSSDLSRARASPAASVQTVAPGLQEAHAL
nr:uncharacterized protein LOC104653096 [Saimiri boliviensis boliviensis]